MTKIVYTNREIIVSSMVIVACLLLLLFFPTQTLFEKMAALFAFLVLLPITYLKLVAKRSLADFGIQLGNWKKGLIGIGLSLTMSFLILYLIVNYTGFSEAYKMIKVFQGNFGKFILYELVYVGTLVLVIDFFLRGFIMFSLAERMKYRAVVVQALLLAGFFWVVNGLNWEVALYLIASPFAGFIAYWSRSLAYSLFFNWIFIVLADTILIRIIK